MRCCVYESVNDLGLYGYVFVDGGDYDYDGDDCDYDCGDGGDGVCGCVL